jgi:hypothetical protein|uniref:Uncharacterized protein n=1 Tax=Mus musculus TaxID=10090 RepID=Q8C9D1_MOUSE|nr:unnamed protein product [Mus musculus]
MASFTMSRKCRRSNGGWVDRRPHRVSVAQTSSIATGGSELSPTCAHQAINSRIKFTVATTLKLQGSALLSMPQKSLLDRVGKRKARLPPWPLAVYHRAVKSRLCVLDSFPVTLIKLNKAVWKRKCLLGLSPWFRKVLGRIQTNRRLKLPPGLGSAVLVLSSRLRENGQATRDEPY